MSYSPGQSVTKTATFIDSDGDRVDPDPITVDIVGPDNVVVVNDDVPVRVSLGYFTYTYELENDADLGTWRIEWRGKVGLVDVFGYEEFSVVEFVDVETQNDFLRARLGEPKGEDDEDGSQTFFTDLAIADLLSYASDNMDLATLEGWRRKLARFARLVDVSESGTTRDLTDKFKNAEVMVKYWEKQVGEAEENRLRGLGRVVGRPVNLGYKESDLSALTPFSGYSEHIREYPTHRLIIPAILG